MQTIAADGQVPLLRSVLARRSSRRILVWLVALCIVMLCALASEPQVFAVDELYLTGVVKNVNTGTGLVYVEVTSDSCRGMRIFRADDRDKLGAYVNQTISFYIDSSTCRDNNTHTILVSWGIKK